MTCPLPRRRLLALGLAAASVSLLPPLARAGGINAEGGLAIRGYDPVAYFAEGRPRRGDPSISAEWVGATWHFASAANRDRFMSDPEGHMPQFGGFCAWAVARGYTAPIDPDAWQIVDGRLYLNYSQSVQRRWQRDIPGFIARAEANWPALRGGT